MALWEKAVPGTNAEKKEAVEELAKFWKKRTGSTPKEHDSIRMRAWLTIAREAIVEQLTGKGLQLKLTANRRSIFCRVRAPIRLLEVQADQDNYPLQLRGEIDPGSDEFWNVEYKGVPVELEEENKIYTLEEAKGVLERLYRAGKISAADITINPEDETEDAWSLRVHALERIADQVPVYNHFIPYATLLSAKPHLRYLFQVYPSVRGMTLFKSKDRLALTKSLIETAFDLEIMIKQNILTGFMALHDANRGEKLTISSLSQKWSTFWHASAKEVGSPTVTHPAYEHNTELWFYERPWAQPLADIRDYFGEKTAMYYAWMGHFTYWLVIPAVLGVLVNLYFISRGDQILQSGLDYPTYGYGFLVLTWAIVYVQCWKRECYAIALKWGTRGFESEEKDRPEFYGEVQRSPITNDEELSYPDSLRLSSSLAAWVSIILSTTLGVSVLLFVFYLEYRAREMSMFAAWIDDWYFTATFCGIVAVIMQINSFWFTSVAQTLNDLENHRTDTDYEDNLVVKMIFFELFNSYGVTAFEAFGKGYIFNDCYINCIVDLRTLLYAILIVRILKSTFLVMYTIVEGILSTMRQRLNAFLPAGGGSGASSSGGDDEQASMLVADNDDDKQFMDELPLANAPHFFADSAGTFSQFSYINLFSITVPVLAVVTLFENLLKIRVDAYKLCRLSRRPFVQQAEDAGFWAETMELMIYAGIYMNTAMILLAYPDMADYNLYVKLILFLAVCQVLVLYVLFVQYLIPAEPDYINEVSKRHEFVIDKYVKGFEDKNESAEEQGIFGDAKSGRGHIDDRIDVDALNLYDLRKAQKVDESRYEEIEKLETLRRELNQELKILRDRLAEIYKVESFNEVTGIGETKTGLPLGRLTVYLVKIADFDNEVVRGRPEAFKFKIRVEIKSKKVGATAPIQKLPESITDSRDYLMPEDGTIDLNQALGPFAPIKTIDAEVFFHLLFVDSNRPNDAPQATVSIRLGELDDQKQHKKKLSWKLRDIKAQERPSGSSLYVNLVFQYSKVVPVRNDIYKVQDKLKKVENTLVRLKSGKD